MEVNYVVLHRMHLVEDTLSKLTSNERKREEHSYSLLQSLLYATSAHE